MTFTTPGILWALPLAGVPFLLHLLSRRRAKRVTFSDLTLLRRVHAQALPRARLRQWLLLAARCLILFFLLLSYAGPMIRSGSGDMKGAASGVETLDLVLLLDASYSMAAQDHGKTRFELARAAGIRLLGDLGPGDRVAVGVFSDHLHGGVEGLSWVNPDLAIKMIAGARLGSRGTDLSAPLSAAYDLLSDSSGRRAVLLLGDGAAHGFGSSLPPSPPGVRTVSLTWPRAGANATILSGGPARASRAAAPRLSLRAAVPGGEGLSTSIEIWVGEKRLDRSALGLRRGEEPLKSWNLPTAPEGLAPAWVGRAVLRPDALAADDEFFYSFRHRPRPRVLCLYGNPSFTRAPQGGYFLKRLFGETRASLLDYESDFIEATRIADLDLDRYAVVILADFKKVSRVDAARLDAYVRRGGGLWVLPGGRTEEGGFQALGKLLPADVGPVTAASSPYGLVPSGRTAKLGIWKEFELQNVALGRYHTLTPKAGAEIAFWTVSGDPLLIVGSRGQGRVAVSASALDTEWTNLAVKPVFAAWVKQVLDLTSRLGGAPTEDFSLRVGEPIVRRWGPDEPAPRRVRVRGPGGRTSTLWVKDREISFEDTEDPGLYRLIEVRPGPLAQRLQVYAVNLDRSGGESDLSTRSGPGWESAQAATLEEDFKLAVYGRDVRGGMVAVAAAFVGLEMLLALPRVAPLLLLLMTLALPASAQQGDRLVWAQWRHGETWDPYPGSFRDVLGLMTKVTSVLVSPERRVVTLKDDAVFSSPLLILAGREAPPPLSESEIRRLRAFLSAGGLLWVEDVSGTSSSSFDRWVRRTLSAVLPESKLTALGSDHVIFKTFFLLRGVAGRVMVRGTLEGVPWAGRIAVIYSRNDLLGVWVKDALGNPLFPCFPGGEAQRHNARKLTLKIRMYSLTGSYKADAVHQPYLLKKLRKGTP